MDQEMTEGREIDLKVQLKTEKSFAYVLYYISVNWDNV